MVAAQIHEGCTPILSRSCSTDRNATINACASKASYTWPIVNGRRTPYLLVSIGAASPLLGSRLHYLGNNQQRPHHQLWTRWQRWPIATNSPLKPAEEPVILWVKGPEPASASNRVKFLLNPTGASVAVSPCALPEACRNRVDHLD